MLCKNATIRLCAFAALRDNSVTTLNLYHRGKMPFVIATGRAAQVAPTEPVFGFYFFYKQMASTGAFSISMLLLLLQAPGAALFGEEGVEVENVKECMG